MCKKIAKPAILLFTATSLAIAEVKPGLEAKEPHVPNEGYIEVRAVGLQVDLPASTASLPVVSIRSM
jgi:hypothetical protein